MRSNSYGRPDYFSMAGRRATCFKSVRKKDAWLQPNLLSQWGGPGNSSSYGGPRATRAPSSLEGSNKNRGQTPPREISLLSCETVPNFSD